MTNGQENPPPRGQEKVNKIRRSIRKDGEDAVKDAINTGKDAQAQRDEVYVRNGYTPPKRGGQ